MIRILIYLLILAVVAFGVDWLLSNRVMSKSFGMAIKSP
jgi:uncharacterized membrane-anchored protein